jgi:hypothetical protein
MKKIIVLLFFVTALFSCSSDDESPFKDYKGKWILTQMTGMTANSKTTGSEMQWQEFYVLDANGTFTKSREKDGFVIEITGTYSQINSSTGTVLLFTYSINSDIIGSCSSELKEELNFLSENVLLSTWQQCDGPGLKYEKEDQK